MIRLAAREVLAHPVRSLLTAVVGAPGVGLVSGALIVVDTAGDTSGDTGLFGNLLLIAGAVALLAGGLVVNSAVSVMLARRTREMALLRRIGAEPAQLRRLVQGEGLLVGLAAAALGLGLGCGLAAALRAVVRSILGGGLVVTPWTVVVALGVGVGTLLLCTLGPARRAGRMGALGPARRAWGMDGFEPAQRASGMEALGPARHASGMDGSGPMQRAAGMDGLGPVRRAAGMDAVEPAQRAGQADASKTARRAARLDRGPRGSRSAAGSGSTGAARVVRAVGWPIAAVFRLPGALARDNAARYARRTLAAAAAVMIGTALVSLTLVQVASAEEVAARDIERTMRADFALGSETLPLDRGAVARLAALKELSTVVPMAGTSGQMAGEQAFVIGVDPAALAEVLALRVDRGNLVGLAAGGIAVTVDQAAAHGWTLGSQVQIELPAGVRTFTVQAVYAGTGNLRNMSNNAILSTLDHAELGGNPDAFAVYARTASGVTPAQARAAIERTLDGQRGAQLLDRSQVVRELTGEIGAAAAVLLSLTGLATAIGLLIAANKLTLSVLDRTRELGLLRAIGMTRRQVRSMVRAEAAIVCIIGAVLGVAVGASSAWLTGVLPIAGLAMVLLLVVATGLLAATLPARSAGQIDVRRAVSTE